MLKGSRLKVEYGTVELNFDSGVRAVIKAPADIEVASNGRMFIGTKSGGCNAKN